MSDQDLSPFPFLKEANFPAIRIFQIGGCGEFGLNMTGLLYHNRLFLVDCGSMFPDPAKLGVDLIIPNFDKLLSTVGGVFAYLITHGHEDHIGALPYFLEKWPAPVYATSWTSALIKHKLLNRKFPEDKLSINVIEAGDRIIFEDMEVTWVHVNHSIPMACALYFKTPQLGIFHSGDLKIDYLSNFESPTDLTTIHKIGQNRVDLLLCDSTNIEKEGFSQSEVQVLQPLEEIVKQATGTIYFTFFSSNIWRIKTILNICKTLKKKVYFSGQSIINAVDLAFSEGLIEPLQDLLVSENEIGHIPKSKLVVLVTGSQGEKRSGLFKLALGEHRHFKPCPDDLVIFSSRIIPGNEKSVLSVINLLESQGVHVISAFNQRDHFEGIHVSGHASQKDIEVLLNALKPRYLMPIHGTFSQFIEFEKFVKKSFNKTINTIPLKNGDVYTLSENDILHSGQIEVEREYVDSSSLLPMTHEELRERLRIGEFGIAILFGVYSLSSGWLFSPTMTILGLALPKTHTKEEWVKDALAEAEETIKRSLALHPCDPAKIKEELRIAIRRYFFKILNKKPVVIVDLSMTE